MDTKLKYGPKRTTKIYMLNYEEYRLINGKQYKLQADGHEMQDKLIHPEMSETWTKNHYLMYRGKKY